MVKRFVHNHIGPQSPTHYVVGYLDHTHYTLKQKEGFLDVASRLLWSVYLYIAVRPKKRVKLFLKDETYPEFKFARGINTRHDESKIFMACFVKVMEEKFYQFTPFVKHVPVKERPAHGVRVLSRLHMSPEDPGAFTTLGDGDLGGLRFYVTDHTAFESAMSPEIMHAFEMAAVEAMFPSYPQAVAMLDRILRGKQTIVNYFASCTRMGGRMSGDLTTSIGNGITNLFSIEWILTSRHIPHSVMVEGDDGLIAVPRQYALDARWWTELGFTVKLDEVKHPKLSGFCGMYYSDLPDGTSVLFREPAKIVASTGWLSANYDRQTALSLMRGRALSLAVELAGEPVITAYTRYLVRKFGVGVARWDNTWWNRHHLESLQITCEVIGKWLSARITTQFQTLYKPISPMARETFHKIFDIDPLQQIELEQHFDELGPDDNIVGAWLEPLMQRRPDFWTFVQVWRA